MLPYIIIIFALSSVRPQECIHEFDKANYSRASILTIKGLPTNLAFDPSTNDLLFTLIDVDTLAEDDVQTKMDQYILKRQEPIKIDEINGQAAAVDIGNNKTYIASDKGLYILNNTLDVEFLSLKDEDIVHLYKPYHTNNLYAVFYPDNKIYVIDVDKNEKHAIEDIPCAFMLAVDSHENVYYECDSKFVKVLLKGFREPIEYFGIGKNAARALTVDYSNRAILASNDGLYHLKPDNVIPKKLMDLDFTPSGIVFDRHDIYISTNDIIYKYTKDDC